MDSFRARCLNSRTIVGEIHDEIEIGRIKPEQLEALLREAAYLLEQEYSRAANIEIKHGDANNVLKRWCKQTDWSRNRAVVCLDPYGMQVDWATIAGLAQTKAVDLWILFPIGVSVNRLLVNREPPPDAWARSLTRCFGEDAWRERIYQMETQLTLFGEETRETKIANFAAIEAYFLKRLGSVFQKVASNPLLLCNSRALLSTCFVSQLEIRKVRPQP